MSAEELAKIQQEIVVEEKQVQLQRLIRDKYRHERTKAGVAQPTSEEIRAEVAMGSHEVKLLRLKERLVAFQEQSTSRPSYPAPVLAYAYTVGSGNVFEYDDEMERALLDVDDEEMFDADVEKLEGGGMLGLDERQIHDMLEAELLTHGVNIHGTAESQSAAKSPGDNPSVRLPFGGTSPPTGSDLLNLAKLGYSAEFQQFAGHDLESVVDNYNRTVLHYAVDGGSEELVAYLLSRGLDPHRRDDRGMSSADIAVILKRTSIAAKFGVPLDAHAALISKLAPPPPRIVAVRPSPPPPQPSGRTFWCPQPPRPANRTAVGPIGAASFPRAMVAALYRGDGAAAAVGPLRWMMALTLRELRSMPEGAIAAWRPTADNTGVTAVVVALPSLGLRTARGAAPLAFTVGCLATHRQLRRQAGVTTGLLSTLAEALSQQGVGAVLFRTASSLPPTCVPVCRLRWYVRVLSPNRVIDHTSIRIVEGLFPDVLRYESILRVDGVLKHALLPPSPAERGHLEGWVLAEDCVPAIVSEIVALISAAHASAELFEAVDETGFANHYMRSGFTTMVRRRAGRVSDAVVFRERHSLDHDDTTGEPLVRVAAVVYAAFSTVPAVERLGTLCHIAQRAEFDAVVASSTHGIDDRELRAAKFEELTEAQEYLYCLGPNLTPVVHSLASPAVFLPIGTL